LPFLLPVRAEFVKIAYLSDYDPGTLTDLLNHGGGRPGYRFVCVVVKLAGPAFLACQRMPDVLSVCCFTPGKNAGQKVEAQSPGWKLTKLTFRYGLYSE
jgi:hypothetical protein